MRLQVEFFGRSESSKRGKNGGIGWRFSVRLLVIFSNFKVRWTVQNKIPYRRLEGSKTRWLPFLLESNSSWRRENIHKTHLINSNVSSETGDAWIEVVKRIKRLWIGARAWRSCSICRLSCAEPALSFRRLSRCSFAEAHSANGSECLSSVNSVRSDFIQSGTR